MNFAQGKHLFVLGGLTISATVGFLTFTPPAESISYVTYNVNASFAGDGGGTISGSFLFSPDNSALFNPFLTITSVSGLYNGTVSNILSAFPSQLILDNNPTNGPNTDINYRLIQLFFVPDLTGSPGEIVSITNTMINSSYVWRGTGTSQEGYPLFGSAQAQPVPIESDAWPIVSAAGFIGIGLWFKRRRAIAKTATNFEST